MSASSADGQEPPARTPATPFDQQLSHPGGTPFPIGSQPNLHSGLLQLQAAFHMGPIPPAQELAAYEQAFPGTVQWILSEAKAAADHAREMERLGMKLASKDAARRRRYPLIVMCLLILMFGCIAFFANVYAGTIGEGVTLAALGVAYFQGAAGQKIGQPQKAEPAK